MSESIDTRHHYGAIDGLRALSAVGIVLMHVQANTGYDIGGFFFNRMIPSFTNLVFLFMVISGFSMCCGYYGKIIRGEITPEEFYSKRFSKVFPFFAILCVLDLAISPSANALYEVFANLTLLFGLLPNANIEVIGVGWFLGLVFVFYLVFPFYCYLLSRKNRAWFSFGIALIFNWLCTIRFTAGRTNILYSGVFFLAGGLIFLYRERLCSMAGKSRFAVILGILAMAIVYYGVSESVPVMLALFSLVLIFALQPCRRFSLLKNPVMGFLSGISMEIYLSHMVIFRVIEKLELTQLFVSDWLSYIATALGTLLGTVFFSVILKRVIREAVQWKSRMRVALSKRN